MRIWNNDRGKLQKENETLFMETGTVGSGLNAEIMTAAMMRLKGFSESTIVGAGMS